MDSSAPMTPNEDGPNDNIDAVRDLLFGRQHPGFTNRVAKAETSVFELDESDDEEAAVEAIEAKLNGVENLLRKEADTRINKDDALRKMVEQKETSLAERISALEGRIQHVESRLLSELEKQSQQHDSNLAALKTELLEQLEQRLSSITDHSVDRVEMGDLLIDLGLKLQPVTEPKEEAG